MRSFDYCADGHHVDDAGNLIRCAYVDFRDPSERVPITTLSKASSKRHAIPGCETIRLSKPSCFQTRDEGAVGCQLGAASAGDSEAGEGAEPAAGEAHYARNGWIYCTAIDPETAEERAAWRESLPAGYNAVSPIRRPRAFARALGDMAAEQAGPRGAVVLLKSTVEGRPFRTAHVSQTVYHGPVVYADDPCQRLERASSELERRLLPVFLKDAADRAQREYRFAVWTEKEPEEDRLDLEVSPALVDAMWKPRQTPEGSGLVPAGADEAAAVEELDDGARSARVRVEAVPAFVEWHRATRTWK
ncbi:MAG: hypothetical protein OXG72_15740 [Acidobacteria bacterium]|nr:hypothetical protein [Acidobacteriota bacterium]